jgi:predicted phage terminase large subunit-like protein
MVLGKAPRRLVTNLPPRSLKSIICSVALPAWLLGRDPATRIICASYSDDLAAKFSRECRGLVETPFYRRLFPQTRLSSKKAAECEFETTRRGGRLATSIGGTLTGRGGTVFIIDDPLKANDAGSEVARRASVDWFRNTALSRLDEPRNSIVLVAMQRLHVDDLSGILIEQGWPSLVIPAIATEPASYPLSEEEVYDRPMDELLQPERDSHEVLEQQKRDLGSHLFAAQYQQNPTPPGGNMIMREWLPRYDKPADRKSYQRVVLSCDPAGKPGAHNDYTAITIVGVQDKRLDLLWVSRGHWGVRQMQDQITTFAAEYNVDLVIVEDTSTGMGLIQLLREQPRLMVIGRTPKGDKETRMYQHQARFEAGRIWLPTEAPWLAEFEAELLAFPHGRYDDQVDALLLFLDWYARMEPCLRPHAFHPPIIEKVYNREPYPWARERHWSEF